LKLSPNLRKTEAIRTKEKAAAGAAAAAAGGVCLCVCVCTCRRRSAEAKKSAIGKKRKKGGAAAGGTHSENYPLFFSEFFLLKITLYSASLFSESTRALTFEEFCQAHIVHTYVYLTCA
jgi:hypothetical protein